MTAPDPGVVLARAAWGALGGALGAFLGHAGGLLAMRWVESGGLGQAGAALAASTGAYYLAVGACLGEGRSRLGAGAAGFAAGAGLTGLPLVLGAADSRGVEAAYSLGNTGAVAAIGAAASGSSRWTGAIGGLAGGLAALGLGAVVRWLRAGAVETEIVLGMLPSPAVLTWGVAWGLCLGLGLGAANPRREAVS